MNLDFMLQLSNIIPQVPQVELSRIYLYRELFDAYYTMYPQGFIDNEDIIIHPIVWDMFEE